MKIDMTLEEWDKIINSLESEQIFKETMESYGFDLDEAMKEYKQHKENKK